MALHFREFSKPPLVISRGYEEKPLRTVKDGFDPISLRLYEFPEDKVYRLFYLLFSDADLQKAVSELPDIGVDRATREARIKEIDADISRLTKTLEEDFA